MLVFSRKRGEAIVVGDGIEVVFLSSGREGVRIGVKAPLLVPVHCKEIYEQKPALCSPPSGRRPAGGGR